MINISFIINVVKKKFFLLPASSKDTNLRSLTQNESAVDPQAVSPSNPPESGEPPAERKKGRLRSVSASIKPLTRSASTKSNPIPYFPHESLRTLQVAHSDTALLGLSSLVSEPNLVGMAQSDRDSDSISIISIAVPEISVDDLSSEPSFTSAEEVSREKIVSVVLHTCLWLNSLNPFFFFFYL